MKRLSIGAAVLGILAALLVGAPASSADDAYALTNAKHFFWSQGQDPQGTADALQNDIIYHGGTAGPGAIGVQVKPAVYLVYWGTEWSTGFTTPDTDGKLYSSKTLQNYLNTFMANLGGSPWAAVQTQYCRNVPDRARRAAPASRAPSTSRTRRTSSRASGPTRRRSRTTSSRSASRRTSSTIRSRWRRSARPRTSSTTRTRRTSS